MGWFNFLRKQKKRHKKLSVNLSRVAALRQSLEKVNAEIIVLGSQLLAIHQTLERHTSAIDRHNTILEEHAGKFGKLEQLVEQSAAHPSISIMHAAKTESHVFAPPQTCDINSFTPQEKRILQVFFQHPDMPLSYIDIARALNKSPLTVKNQIHQIGIKADLFAKSLDAQSRNRFRLKDGVRLEKYLHLV